MFSGFKRKPLSTLEQSVMDYVWANPGCTADACREALAASRNLKDSTVRTIFRRLEEKGYVTHQVEGRTYLYRAADQRQNVAADAVRGIVDRFCGGSVEQLLVGLVDNDVIDSEELEQLARKIALRKEGQK
jgi:predicted transcriptional regulator